MIQSSTIKKELEKYYDNKSNMNTITKLNTLCLVMKSFYDEENTIMAFLKRVNGREINVKASPSVLNSLLNDTVNVLEVGLCKFESMCENIEEKYDHFDTSVLLDNSVLDLKLKLNIVVNNNSGINTYDSEVNMLLKNFNVDFIIKLFTVLMVIK